MKTTARLFTPMLTLIVAACSNEIGVYEGDWLHVYGAELGKGGELTLKYETLQETLYASPGVRIQQQGDELRVRVIRCAARTRCDTDVQSKSDGPRRVVLIPNMRNVSSVVFEGQKSKQRIAVISKSTPGEID